MSAHVAYASNPTSYYDWASLKTSLTQAVPPGYQITITAPIEELPAGSWKLEWDLESQSNLATWWSQNSPASPVGSTTFTLPHYDPFGEYGTPQNGSTVSTTTPALTVLVFNDQTNPIHVNIQACNTGAHTSCVSSGWQSAANVGSFTNYLSWTVPTGKLYWNAQISWTFQIEDGTRVLPWASPTETFVPVVTQPTQVQLGSSPSYLDSQGVNMYLLQYVKSEADLSIGQTAPAAPNQPGQPLQITRTYNSADTTTHAFGVGWSSILDMSWTTATDGNSFTIRLADGSSRTYAKNPDGSWAGGFGWPTNSQIFATTRTIVLGGISYSFATSGTVGALSQVTYGPHESLQLIRNSSGQVADVHDNYSGRDLYLTWTGSQVTNESSGSGNTGRVWSFGHNSSAELTSVCNADNQCESYVYNASKQLTLATPPSGVNKTSVVYTSGGLVANVGHPSITATWSYARVTPGFDQPGEQYTVQVTDPRRTQWYMYNASGALMIRWSNHAVPADADQVDYGYDFAGNLRDVIDQNENITEYWYDPIVGGILETDDYRANEPPNQMVTFEIITSVITRYVPSSLTAVDPRAEQPLQTKDANGHITTYTYDPDGQVATKATPTGSGGTAVTSYHYTCENGSTAPATVHDPGNYNTTDGLSEPCGALASVTDPHGATTSYRYDRYGDVSRTTDPSGKVTDYANDAFGDVVQQTVTTPQDPVGRTTWTSYDQMGRPTSTVGDQFENGYYLTVNRQTNYSYSADGVLTQTDDVEQADGDEIYENAHRTTVYGLDGADRVTSVTESGIVTSRAAYNAFGQPTDTWDGNGNHTTYTYDPSGQLYSKTLVNFVNPANYPNAGQTRSITLQSNSYDPAGRLTSTTDAMGRTVNYTYTLDNLVSTETETTTSQPQGGTGAQRVITLHHYLYDNAGNVLSDTTSSDEGSVTKTATYDDGNHPLTSTLDPSNLNRVTKFSYDPAGELTSTTLTDTNTNRSASLTYDSAGQIATSTVHNGGTDLTTAYTHDAFGHVIALTDPRGVASNGTTNPAFTTTTTYDALDQITSETTPPVAVEDGSGAAPVTRSGTTNYRYDAYGEVTAITYPSVMQVTYAYDNLGRIVQKTSDAGTESWVYDADGNPTSYTDRRGNTTNYTYDALNRLTTVTKPPVSTGSPRGTTSYIYNDDGQRLSSVDPEGAQAATTYDDRGRPASSLGFTQSSPTRLGFDDFGHQVLATVDGIQATATYNAAGDLLTQAETGRGTTTRTYNAADEILTQTDPAGVNTTDTYNPAGLLVSTQQAGGSLTRTQSFGYDPAGNLTSETDSRNNTVTATYDARNELRSVASAAVHNADGSTAATPMATFGYDVAGDRTRTTDGNGDITLTTYNRLALPTTVTVPSTPNQTTSTARQWSYTYDPSGHPLTQTEPDGVKVTSTYDNLGDLTSQTGTINGSTDSTKTLGYDADGHLTSYNEPGGSGTVTWNQYDLPVSVAHTTSAGVTTRTDTATYDDLGRIATSSDLGGSESYTYSGPDLHTVTDADGTAYTYGYDAAGRPSSQTTTSSGASAPTDVQGWTYDGLGRVASQTYVNPGTSHAGAINYIWDTNNNLASQTATGELATSTPNINYTYDESNRLITATNTNSARSVTGGVNYTWDPAGNRTSQTKWTGSSPQTGTAAITNYVYDARNRLTSQTAPAGTTNYGYDQRGDQTSTSSSAGPVANATYDSFGRVTSDTSQGAGTMTYDGLDRMITTASGLTPLTYPGLGREPVSGAGWALLRLPDGTALGQRAPSSTGNAPATGDISDLVRDVHGDTVASLAPATQNGGVSAVTNYDAFGNSTNTSVAPIGWQGSLVDPTTGRIHADSRWYDPGTGGFTSQDTDPPAIGAGGHIPSPGLTNLYAYGNANPGTRLDPSGHLSIGDLFGDVVGDVKSVGNVILDGIGSAADGLGAAAPELADAAGTAVSTVVAPEVLVVGGTVLVIGGGAAALNAILPSSDSGRVLYGPDGKPEQMSGSPVVDYGSGETVSAPHRTGTTWTETTQTTVTPQRWQDDQNVYTRTETTTSTVTKTWTYMSDGSVGYTVTPGSTTTYSPITLTPIYDTPNQLVKVVNQPVRTTPIVGMSAAADGSSGTCGAGGSVGTCGQQQAALPTGGQAPGNAPATLAGGGGSQQPPPVTNGAPSCEDPSDGSDANNGNASRRDGARNFFDANPNLKGQVWVHHSIEWQSLGHYPGLFSPDELNSLPFLRGIPKEINSRVHLSDIRKAWNRFYRDNPDPTREDMLNQREQIDQEFGDQFNPPC